MYLPPEIIDHIVASVELQDTPTLLHLSLANRTMYDISVRYLFRSPVLRNFSQTFYFTRLLTRKPHLAAHVRALSLTMHHPSEIKRQFMHTLRTPAYLRLVFRSLRLMANLRNLTFTNMEAGYRCTCGENLAEAKLPIRRLCLPTALEATQLLESTPSIEDIDLPDPEPTYALDTLAKTALPNVHTVRLVRNSIVYFVPERPVTKLSIVGIITPDEVPIFLAPLGRSTGPLKRLSLHVFKADTSFYEEVAACVPYLVDLVAYSDVEDHVKTLSHLKRDACIEAFRGFRYMETLELHAASVGRVVTSVKALPLVPLMAAARRLRSLVLINEKDRHRQEVERYYIDESRGNAMSGYWVRQVEVTEHAAEFIARRPLI